MLGLRDAHIFQQSQIMQYIFLNFNTGELGPVKKLFFFVSCGVCLKGLLSRIPRKIFKIVGELVIKI